MKAIVLFLLQWPLWGIEFRRFDSLQLGIQTTSGVIGAGLGYLFLQQISFESMGNRGTAQITPVQALAGLSAGYTLGVIFSGKIFQARGNPFLTFAGNLVPLLGPLIIYHLTAGSVGFSDALALFHLSAGRLSLGLPIPHRNSSRFDRDGDVLYYVNLVTISL